MDSAARAGGSGPQKAHPSMRSAPWPCAVSGGPSPPLQRAYLLLRSGLDSGMRRPSMRREGAGVIDATQRLRLSYLDAASALLL